MNIHDATETAYRNGYEQGKKDAVKHGHWVFDGLHLWCSECAGFNIAKTNYCPNCGAEMDGDTR